MRKILVSGGITYDLLLSYDGSFAEAIQAAGVEHLSVSFFSPRFARHHGGTGANIAWNLRLLNQTPLLAGVVGYDGGEFVALLQERGIGVDRIAMLPDHATSTAIIGTDSAERQIAFFHPGAEAHGEWPDLAEDRDDCAVGIVSPRDMRLMMQSARWCQTYAVPYLFDPGQQIIRLHPDELKAGMRGSTGVIVNDYEWSLLSQRIGLDAEGVLREAPMLVVTQGEAGLTIYTRGETIVLHGCPAEKVMNPTGAGDALRAGFLTGMSAGWTPRQCGMLGASMGSFVVEYEGTLLDALDINDVLGRAETAYGEALPALP